MSQGNYIARDYGNHLNQTREWRELVGLEDPADRYDPAAGPAIRFELPVTCYPIDEAA